MNTLVIERIENGFELNRQMYFSQQERISQALSQNQINKALAEVLIIEDEGGMLSSLKQNLWMPDYKKMCVKIASHILKFREAKTTYDNSVKGYLIGDINNFPIEVLLFCSKKIIDKYSNLLLYDVLPYHDLQTGKTFMTMRAVFR